MKKNITINLCGRLFNIDEDAFELLRHYTDTLRSYFSRQEGGDEIVDDLEQRIGELLDELKNQGVEAINIDHVKEVITRIGQPEEMDDCLSDSSTQEENAEGQSSEPHSSSTHENQSRTESVKDFVTDFVDNTSEFFRGRRFYRNPKDKMIAGVLSGLSSSFEVDVTLLRLGVVACVLLFSMLGSLFGHSNWHMLFSLAFIYVILAFIMPVAETPEQQLKMQGKPVNVQNLAEEVVQNVTEKVDKVKRNSGTKGVLNGILKFFAGCFKVIMVLFAVSLFFGGVALLLFALFAIYSPDYVSHFFSWHMEPIIGPHLHLFMAFMVVLLATLLIPAYAIIQHLVHPLKVYQRIVLLFVWIAALAATIVTGAMLTNVSDKFWDESIKSQRESINEYIVTDEGIKMKLYEYDFLAPLGWTILKGEGCNGRFTTTGEYYIANRFGARYLDCYDEHHRQRYRAENGESLMPGTYKLTVAVRANGRGAFVYTLIDGHKQLQEIPVTGNVGGSIWQMAVDSLNHVGLTNSSDEDILRSKPTIDYFKEIAKANHGKGFGWSRLEFYPIKITKPHTIVNYGVTTDPDFTGQTWLGQWFSACDFIIERVDGEK